MNKRNSWEMYQAIYVHIPFCKQKCLYCDFPSFAGFREADWFAYARAVVKEIEVVGQRLRSGEMLPLHKRATVFFGGGTPSLLPVEALELMVRAMQEQGIWQEPAEATIEANPGTVDLEKLKRLRSLGFDRISFGLQSLNDLELRTIGRIHTAEQGLEAIELAKKAGFERINCDLMYGLPGQTLESLQRNLQLLCQQGLEHLSVYGLILEEGTALERLVRTGKIVLPDEDAVGDMYDYVQSFLKEQGLLRYEISNYAKPGQESSHNKVYWQYKPYLGLGAAATGFDGVRRSSGIERVEKYIALMEAGSYAEAHEEEQLTQQELLGEYCFMNLRKRDGIDLEEFAQRFGIDFRERYGDIAAPYVEQGYLQYINQGRSIALTELGMTFGNQIFALF